MLERVSAKLDVKPRTPANQRAEDSASGRRLQDATYALLQRSPAFSAAWGARPWQSVALLLFSAMLGGGWISTAFEPAGRVALLALLATFLGVIALRGLVLWHIAYPLSATCEASDLPDDALPSYSILVAVYRETAVIEQLVRGLGELDYPADKLQILFITEEHDAETQEAIRNAPLARHMRLVVVPEGGPRTKPRALNYALAEASGEYVVVYDAEDVPDRGQLREAASRFRLAGPRLGCLQGQLKIYNADGSWLTRMFAIEYAALFGCVLPALARFGLPIPLGGTSNHFPRHVLESVGRWDPFNVTEDADLGVRLARAGWRVGVLASATWEEAPPRFRDWRLQRVRWQKGWLQTALVHTRHPLRLWRELGTMKTVAVCIMFASMLLSALVNPIYLAALAWSLYAPGVSDAGLWWWLGVGVFLSGYAVSLAVAAIAARRSGYANAGGVWSIPLYWLLISFAAYGALVEYWRWPFRWNKTPHTGRMAARASR